MNLELHHVAILCDDLQESLQFYRDTLYLQVVAHVYQEGLVELALLSDRSASPTFLLALHGQPFSGWPLSDFKEHGPGLNSLGFVARLELFPSPFIPELGSDEHLLQRLFRPGSRRYGCGGAGRLLEICHAHLATVWATKLSAEPSRRQWS